MDVKLRAAAKRAFESEKTPGADELIGRLRRFRGRLPKDFKFDRLEANEQAIEKRPTVINPFVTL